MPIKCYRFGGPLRRLESVLSVFVLLREGRSFKVKDSSPWLLQYTTSFLVSFWCKHHCQLTRSLDSRGFLRLSLIHVVPVY